MPRNLSIDAYLLRLASRHTPRYRFSGSTAADWRNWRSELHPTLMRTLGVMPAKVPPSPEVLCEWREDGLVKQKVVFDVEDGLSAVAYVFRPDSASGRLPAILCCHGHGPYGKESVMGNGSDPDMRAKIQQHNYDYGLQMAKAGFVTIAIDWRGFGQRDDRRKPHFHDLSFGRDPCNVMYLRATMLGMTVLGMDIHDGRCALDHLCAQPFVDPARIGVMGLSFGGTMTTWMAIADDRIKAADIMCYSDRFVEFGYREVNLCGSQVTPGIFALADVPDLHGLIAPRPLLVEIGIHDECFLIEGAMSCFREVEKIYSAAGCREKLDLDLFQGGHGWGANKSVAFFNRHL